MSSVVTSHITHLLYRDAPLLNLARVVTDIRDRFTPAKGPETVLTWDCDDLALLDFGTARVVIGYCDGLPGAHAACLTVATGPTHLIGATPTLSQDQKSLGQAIAKRLMRRIPCDTQHAQTLDQPLTADLIDGAVDALFQSANADQKTPVRAPVLDAFPEVAEQIAPADTDHLIKRLSAELTTRAPNLITRAIQSASPKSGNALAEMLGKARNATKGAIGVSEHQSAKPKGRLFWRKATPDRPLETQSHHPTNAELKAVRDALCAKDMAKGPGRFALQTKQALRGLVGSISELRRRDDQSTGGRIKH